ncbi:MAG: hypothetical protein Q7R95_04655, partial [bacterium]|nr:hypothetical protein [bacterium]
SILGIVFLISTILLYFQNQKLQKQVTNQQVVPIAQIPSPTSKTESSTATPTDEMVGWKTYKGKIYEFKYPFNWSVFGEENNLMIYDKQINTPSGPDFVMTTYISDADLLKGVKITDPINTKVETADKVFEEVTENIKLGNQKTAVKAKIEVMPGSQTNVVSGMVVKSMLNNQLFSIRLFYQSTSLTSVKLTNIFYQILSTFKFVD